MEHVSIHYDMVYPFNMDFHFDEKDDQDRKRLRKLLDPDKINKNGKQAPPVLDIPLRLVVRTNEGTILVDQVVKVGRLVSWGARELSCEIGKIRLVPGRYQITFQSLESHPELEHTPVKLVMYGYRRGNMFAIAKNEPSDQMKALLSHIRETDQLNNLIGLKRLKDNSYPAATGHPNIEGYNIPMPVAEWNACAYWINLDKDTERYWIERACGDSKRQVYQGSPQKNHP